MRTGGRTCRQTDTHTDRRDKANSHFHNFSNTPTNRTYINTARSVDFSHRPYFSTSHEKKVCPLAVSPEIVIASCLISLETMQFDLYQGTKIAIVCLIMSRKTIYL